MSSTARVRCRYGKCSNYEDVNTPFLLCSRCNLARYCSKECIQADYELHKLMCSSKRVLIDEQGNTQEAQVAIQQMSQDFEQLEVQSATKQDKIEDTALQSQQYKKVSQEETFYLKPTEYTDQAVMQSTLGRLQYETNVFYVDQYEKYIARALKKKQHNKTKLSTLNFFLFIQTETTVADCRWQSIGTQAITDSEIPTPPTSLDRGFVCHLMTQNEFELEVVPNHPLSTFFKSTRFKDGFNKLFNLAEYQTQVVVLGMFGCGALYVGKLDLPPWDTLHAQYLEQKEQFADQDCVEIYIDRI